MNLVGSTADEALRNHVEDSLSAAADLRDGARVVDLGSGAGFPGVPIAIARPDLAIVLVEIRERRVHFLRHVVRELELGAEVLRGSIDDAPDTGFDVALVRALAPPERALAMASPWIVSSGEIWIWTKVSIPAGFEEVGAVSLGERGRIAKVIPR